MRLTNVRHLGGQQVLENAKDVAAAHGVLNMSPQDHNGLDNRARVMIKIEDGKWLVIK